MPPPGQAFPYSNKAAGLLRGAVELGHDLFDSFLDQISVTAIEEGGLIYHPHDTS